MAEAFSDDETSARAANFVPDKVVPSLPMTENETEKYRQLAEYCRKLALERGRPGENNLMLGAAKEFERLARAAENADKQLVSERR
jgi:hypothetical protein